jgi:hypothetical protein
MGRKVRGVLLYCFVLTEMADAAARLAHRERLAAFVSGAFGPAAVGHQVASKTEEPFEREKIYKTSGQKGQV